VVATPTRATRERQYVSVGRVVLRDISWDLYERLLAAHVDKSVPHFNYDRGVLEIVSPRREHDRIGRALEHVIAVLTAEWGIDIDNSGSTTFKRADIERGFEVDAAFYIANEPLVRHGRELDLAVDPPPDLVIEIDVTHDSMDKLPLYATMGVPEIWRWIGGRAEIRVLREAGYALAEVSNALPPVTGETLEGFMTLLNTERRTVWEQAVRDWARAQRR
jgi:Uma2 family endonuclease